MSDIYRGEFKDNEFEGYGEMLFANGSHYQGQALGLISLHDTPFFWRLMFILTDTALPCIVISLT